MQTPTTWHYSLIYVHLAVCLVLAVYGVHRYSLVYLYYKYRRNNPRKSACFLQRPRVTIQLPMYNEPFVARRVIEQACQIDYPPDRLKSRSLTIPRTKRRPSPARPASGCSPSATISS
jgi:cellulose synthase/poly-beta-1,6-N-acetylglucosamine synthase-like glycosyltransferase